MKLPNQPKVLAATYNPVSNTKMISFLVDFPTVYLAELRTHRILTQGSLYEHMEHVAFNMSANSARAIPADKYVQKIKDNPFVPIWTTKQKGMQGGQTSEEQDETATMAWNQFLNGKQTQLTVDHEQGKFDIDLTQPGLIDMHQFMVSQGIHKQQANRILAPFAYTTCIISGTEWDNFFELRCPKYQHLETNAHGFLDTTLYNSKKEYLKKYPFMEDVIKRRGEQTWKDMNKSGAQPEFQVIAEMLYDLYQEAEWKESKYHVPFESDIYELYASEIFKQINPFRYAGSPEQANEAYNNIFYNKYIMKISASMCAKLSYNTQENVDTFEKHLERAQMLIDSNHSEPFSHQAIAMNDEELSCFNKQSLRKLSLSKLTTTEFPENQWKKYENKNNCLVSYFSENNKLSLVTEKGWCYNLRGFISQRYVIENF